MVLQLQRAMVRFWSDNERLEKRLVRALAILRRLGQKAITLKGLCHGSPPHFVLFCQLIALNRYGTESRQRNYM